MGLYCPNCGKTRSYLLLCPRCGWIGCERELNKEGMFSYCPVCESRITRNNRIRDPIYAYKAFAEFYCKMKYRF